TSIRRSTVRRRSAPGSAWRAMCQRVSPGATTWLQTGPEPCGWTALTALAPTPKRPATSTVATTSRRIGIAPITLELLFDTLLNPCSRRQDPNRCLNGGALRGTVGRARAKEADVDNLTDRQPRILDYI